LVTAHVNDYVTKGDIVMTRGQKICAFIKHYCLIPEGAQMLNRKLIKFQRKFILDVFDNPHGARRAYLSVARKDGKSAIIAAILLALLRARLDRL
jgi:phage terminase large subunit-like protein